jgi:hypothetical protein
MVEVVETTTSIENEPMWLVFDGGVEVVEVCGGGDNHLRRKNEPMWLVFDGGVVDELVDELETTTSVKHKPSWLMFDGGVGGGGGENNHLHRERAHTVELWRGIFLYLITVCTLSLSDQHSADLF